MPAVNVDQIYKYRLMEFFIRKFGANYSKAIQDTAKQYGFSYRTAQRDCAVRIKQVRTIPPDRLNIYANILNVPANELRSHL